MTIAEDRSVRQATTTPSLALRFLPVTALVLDAAVVTVAGALAVMGRRHLPIFVGSADLAAHLTLVGPLTTLAWLTLVWLRGGYRENVFGAGTDEYKRVLTASLLAAGALGVGCYLARYQLSRGFFVLVFAIGIPLLILGRLGLRRALYSARRQGMLRHRILIVGNGAHVDEVAGVLSRETWLGYQVIGALTPAHESDEETPGGLPVMGNVDDVTGAVVDTGADVVFFAGGGLRSANEMRRIAWALAEKAVQVVVAPSVTDVSSERVRIRPVGGLPLIHIDAPRATDAARWGKRLFDILVSALLLVLCAPVLLVGAACIKLADGGPVLFRQTRTGRRGVEFSCLKLRTMVVDAEATLADLHAESGYSHGLFKLEDDPRVTRPGRWLRRFSLDELPQLVNVLRGDMSLVGPRPPLPLEVARYENDTQRRLHVRPGMTGLWQVSGRSNLSYAEAIRLDLFYVDNWSMLQDLTILARTIGAVVSGRGAY